MELPEIFPRITKEKIKASPSLFSGKHLDKLVKLLNALGVFGTKPLSNRKISHRMYETFPSKGKNDSSDELDDTHAENRIEYILYKSYPLIAEEIEFFRACLERAFGKVAVSTLSDNEICCHHPATLIRQLLEAPQSVELGEIDPLIALISLAISGDEKVDIFLEVDKSTGNRHIELDENFNVDFDAADVLTLNPGTPFRVFIPKKQARSEPLIINFSLAHGLAGHPDREKSIDYRGQILEHVVSTEEKVGPWRVAMPGNSPFRLGTQLGRFGFLVISDFSGSVEDLFPDDFDGRALVNDDYQELLKKLSVVIASGQSPKLGVLLYDVVE